MMASNKTRFGGPKTGAVDLRRASLESLGVRVEDFPSWTESCALKAAVNKSGKTASVQIAWFESMFFGGLDTQRRGPKYIGSVCLRRAFFPLEGEKGSLEGCEPPNGSWSPKDSDLLWVLDPETLWLA